MSQFWHSHWAEDAYKPGLLGNWQVPNWHPKWPCRRHCVTTSFLADRSGRLLPDKPKSKRSPWGDFKGTWELPLKIDRELAQELSAPPRYKMNAWAAHKAHYEGPCGFAASPKTVKMKPESPVKRRKSPAKSVERRRKPITRSRRSVDRNKKTTAKAKNNGAKGTFAEQKRRTSSPTTLKKIGKTREAPKLGKIKKAVPKARSEAPRQEDDKNTLAKDREYERDQNTVSDAPEFEEQNTVRVESEYEEKKDVTGEPKYRENNTVTGLQTYEEKNNGTGDPHEYREKSTVAGSQKYKEKNNVIGDPDEYREINTVAGSQKHKEKNNVTGDPDEYREKNSVSGERERKSNKRAIDVSLEDQTTQNQSRNVGATQCLCTNNFVSHSAPEHTAEATLKICTIHQRLRV